MRMRGPAEEAEGERGLIPFFALVLVLSLPFWILGALAPVQPLAGLPLSGLMAFMPAVAAAILVARSGGRGALAAFLRRAFDGGRMRGRGAWPLLILLMPALGLVAWTVVDGAPTGTGATPWIYLAMFVAFLAAGLGEELGWCGYAIEPMARRLGELRAALLLGAFWALWHVVPFLQAGRGWDWIAWQCANIVAVRVVMTRLYFGAGRSVFAVALFHALDNVAAFSLPFFGGRHDPRFLALSLAGIAAVLTLVRLGSERRQ
ncbi:CPBP family intramembrane glutamic endopeptidase [Phenylobacterium sp.]|uniref:CPBP family intramembrane glutamic endopeptidase n=1 Tax=Phenylobacterium sp. TaxID=1871053 RepID=UPI002CB67F90|nr:CPBP family intramembrane glutamic endopeptidase [Phenylobacterium sp.]HVI34522.1 CPBP family intramembrane glutamic endopeptidase [Phenylobacterium sp.]